MTFSQTSGQLHKPTLNTPKRMCNLKSDKYSRPAGQTDASESERTHQTRRTAFRDVNNWTTETPLRLSRTFRNVRPIWAAQREENTQTAVLINRQRWRWRISRRFSGALRLEKIEDGLQLVLMCSTWKEADKEKVRRTKWSGSDKCLVNIQTEHPLQTCARAPSEEPAYKGGNNERPVSFMDILETIAIPSCDVLSWVDVSRRRQQTYPCLFEWC